MVILDRKTLSPELAKGEVPGTLYGMYVGWMDMELFDTYTYDIFGAMLQQRGHSFSSWMGIVPTSALTPFIQPWMKVSHYLCSHQIPLIWLNLLIKGYWFGWRRFAISSDHTIRIFSTIRVKGCWGKFLPCLLSHLHAIGDNNLAS